MHLLRILLMLIAIWIIGVVLYNLVIFALWLLGVLVVGAFITLLAYSVFKMLPQAVQSKICHVLVTSRTAE